jgi:tetratricopeptide (TPR) repeat protein
MTTALLVGIGHFDQSNFQVLSSPEQDVNELRELLRHPQIGASRKSDVTTLKDPTVRELRNAIEIICSNRQPHDVVLIYISGYGIVDDRGQLYFPCRDTHLDRLDYTAYPSAELLASMEACRSQQQVLILDCCFSGSFAKGMILATDIDAIGLQLSSRRRAVLTSPWSIDYSPKHKSANPSTYTQYLLNGLETGMADGGTRRAVDGDITVLELQDYIGSRLEEDHPAMFAKLYNPAQSGNIIVARAPYLDFRREALGLASRGEISLVGQSILEELRVRTGVPQEIASAIKKDALLPYQHQSQKQRQFETVQAEITRREMPLSDNTKTELARLRELYELETDPFIRPTGRVTQAPIDLELDDGDAAFAVTAIEEPSNGAVTTEPPAEPENGMSRFFRSPGSVLTPLRSILRTPSETPADVPDDPVASPEGSPLGTPEGLRLGLISLGILALLGTVLWLAFSPLFPGSTPQFASANEWFNEAFQRAQRRDRSGAIDAYTQALNLNASNPAFYYNRAIEQSNAGDYNSAISDYTLAIQYNSSFADAYFNRGNAYARQGNRDAALKDYQEAERLYREQGKTELQQDAQNAIRNLQGQSIENPSPRG